MHENPSKANSKTKSTKLQKKTVRMDTGSDNLQPPRQTQARQHHRRNDADDAKEPAQPHALPSRHRHVHAEQAADQVQRHEDGGQQGDLAEDLVGAVALRDVVDRQLRQVVAVAAAEHLLEVAEVGHHRHHVVLDVPQVEPDLAARGDAVGFVAALGEALDDVRFAPQEAHEGHDLLSAFADLAQERGEVVGARDEDLVLDGVGLGFDAGNGRAVAVDDVIDHGVADPVGGQSHVVAQLADALADVGGVRGRRIGEGEDAFAEDDHVDIERLHVVGAERVELIEGAEADEVVLFEELDFLACFLRRDVFGCQGMDAKGTPETVEFLMRRVQAVEPPDAAVGREGEKVAEGFACTEEVAEGAGVDGLFKLGRKEAEAARLDHAWTPVKCRNIFDCGMLLINDGFAVVHDAFGVQKDRVAVTGENLRNFWVLLAQVVENLRLALRAEAEFLFRLASDGRSCICNFSDKFIQLLEIDPVGFGRLVRLRKADIILDRIMIRCAVIVRFYVSNTRKTGTTVVGPTRHSPLDPKIMD